MSSDASSGRRWRWANIPIPKSHLSGLALGALLQRVYSWKLPIPRRPAVVVGLSSICLNVLVIAWSVQTMGRVVSSDPEHIVDRGPYALSRNPMYVAWTGLYLGCVVLVRSVWGLLLTPVVVTAVHRTVLREESRLARSFGAAYRSYRARVPRYV